MSGTRHNEARLVQSSRAQRPSPLCRMLWFGLGRTDRSRGLQDQKLTTRILEAPWMAPEANVRGRAQDTCWRIAPLPNDSEIQRLRELSLDYIREAEGLE